MKTYRELIEGLDQLHPIFAHCLGDPDFSRYDLSRPVRVGGVIYATNGMIAVKGEAPPGWNYPKPDRYPKVSIVYEGPTSRGAYRREPTPIPYHPVRPCSLCEGRMIRKPRGGGPAACVQCERTGVDGDTATHCVLYHDDTARAVGMSTRYIAILRKFSAMLYLPQVLGTGHPGALRFTVGPIEGRIMPAY